MRRNSAALIAVAVAGVLSGCGADQVTVYVDASLFAVPEPPAALGSQAADITSSVEPSTGSLFALREAPAVRGALGREAEKAKDILEQDRRDAREALRAQLVRVHQKAVDVWRKEEKVRLDDLEKADIDDAYAEIALRLQETAPEQGALMAELAYRVAFPIPLPGAWPPVPADSPWRKARRLDTLDRYQRLQELRRQFLAQTEGILEAATRRNKERRAEFNRELEQRLDEAAKAADEEADAVLLASGTAYESVLATTTTRPQPAMPEKSIAMPGSENPASIGFREPENPLSSADSKRASLMHDLQIWCAEKGYRLSMTPGRGRNVTKEFLAWRNTHHPGR